jgi:hypothetical protein
MMALSLDESVQVHYSTQHLGLIRVEVELLRITRHDPAPSIATRHEDSTYNGLSLSFPDLH